MGVAASISFSFDLLELATTAVSVLIVPGYDPPFVTVFHLPRFNFSLSLFLCQYAFQMRRAD